MNEAILLANILGAAALLLWGLRMVGTGVTRAFEMELRRWLKLGADNRLKALFLGLFVTLILQSSTAACLMAASFIGQGFMPLLAGQAAMLGANIGTSLIVKLLTFNIGPLSAVLVLAGFLMHRLGAGRKRHAARILIGLGIMLLSLRLLDEAAEPLGRSEELRAVLQAIDGAWLIGLSLAAVLAMLAHSSVASILLLLPLAGRGDFGLPFGLALILGANLGSALPPVLESRSQKAVARRLPLGNLLVRTAGCLAMLPFLDAIAAWLSSLEGGRAAQLVDFHILFNLGLALIFLPLTGPLAKLLGKMMPDEPESDDPRRARYLDPAALATPVAALGAATREVLRMADFVETMLRDGLEALRHRDARPAAGIGETDNIVDALHGAVKLYLARLASDDLDPDIRGRVADVVTFAINLEHIGDIIDHNLKGLIEKKRRRGLSFSDEGFADIDGLFTRTIDNLRRAATVFVTADADLARELVVEKAEIRECERQATEAHLARLGLGRQESIETSALHIDILRDLKRINAHIASVAYPILEKRGELGMSRLRTAQ